MAIILVMTALLVPAFNALSGGNNFTRAAYDIAGTLDQARAYAMANKTYVFVGIEEVDVTVSSSASPQTAATATTGGRVAVAVVASRDGTRGYDVISPGDGTTGSWVTNYSNYNGVTTPGANLVAISKLQYFSNVHLAPLFSTLPNSGGLARPTVSQGTYQIGNKLCKSATPFDWPLGKALNTGQYSFQKVINFDPQGVARIQYQSNQDNIVEWMDMGLQQTHGNTVSTGPNAAAIQIDSMSGPTHIYRP